MWDRSGTEFNMTVWVIISALWEAGLWVTSRFKMVRGRTVAVPEPLQTVSFLLFPGTATDLQLQETKREVRNNRKPCTGKAAVGQNTGSHGMGCAAGAVGFLRGKRARRTRFTFCVCAVCPFKQRGKLQLFIWWGTRMNNQGLQEILAVIQKQCKNAVYNCHRRYSLDAPSPKRRLLAVSLVPLKAQMWCCRQSWAFHCTDYHAVEFCIFSKLFLIF